MKPPVITESDDGSLSLQWLSDKRRFVIIFEVDPKETNWHYLEKREIGGARVHGLLSDLSSGDIKRMITEVDNAR